MSKKTRPAPGQKVQDGSALTELGAQIAEWKEITAWRATSKVREIELRNQICAALFPDGLVEGTNKLESEDGNAIIKQPYTYKLDETALDAVMPELGKLNEELLDVSGKDALIRYKPELNLARYRLLSEEEKEIFDQVLTITPGLPSLELTLPSDVTAAPEETPTPIMDKYEAAKKASAGRSAPVAASSAPASTIGHVAGDARKRRAAPKASFARALKKGAKSRPVIAALLKKAPAKRKRKAK